MESTVAGLNGGADVPINDEAASATSVYSSEKVERLIEEAVAQRLSLNEAQTLTAEQKAAVEKTLNLGDTDTDFAARFLELVD
ncbi:hypothetical protein [Bergeriella denitrificans]|uniref:Uncharacterized protein n=1 Tax=Bergeriella denitrificans TaxID=494 RepID=A0A378UIP3_BERDE|nr:hypothetical protein [Bergeriella denitrificans]STZ76352.1 Uncharacterised protein [Bergeriella denitrificans]